MSRKNGGIIGPANTPVGGLFKAVAGGVWRMNDVANFVGNSQWPTIPQSIDNSLKFNRASSDSLTRTPSEDGDRQKFTISLWIKKSSLSVQQLVFSCGTYSEINLKDDGQLYIQVSNNNTTAHAIRTNRVLRDVSAWYNVVVACDTTQGTASNRLRLYINGSEETSFALDQRSDITQNMSTAICGQFEHRFGIDENTSNYYGGYLAEAVLIDGQQLDPTSFGETDTTTGIWKPKKIGTFTSAGTNSFYLDFKDSSNVGKDASGLSNNFTVNNLTSIDQSTDTCVENFATMNPLIFESSSQTFSEGNLKLTGGGSDSWTTHYGLSTIAVNSGKWYVETKATTTVTSQAILGLISTSEAIGSSLKDEGVAAVEKSGRITGGGSDLQTGLTAFSNGDIAGLAFDADNGTAQFYRNGSTYGSAVSSIASDTYYFATNSYDAGAVVEFNFGNPPFSISSGNSDANGFGNFEYSVPSGYYALNTSNLNTYG